jgi:hypothetical protein
LLVSAIERFLVPPKWIGLGVDAGQLIKFAAEPLAAQGG